MTTEDFQAFFSLYYFGPLGFHKKKKRKKDPARFKVTLTLTKQAHIPSYLFLLIKETDFSFLKIIYILDILKTSGQ